MNYPTPVHILATCRNPELLRATTLVFDTLRTGFPTADVTVYINGETENKLIREAAINMGGVNDFQFEATVHHEWIRDLLKRVTVPFWICDTDVIFWESMEDIAFDQHYLVGRFIPQFYDDYMKCITRPRLHPSLLYFDPAKIREKLDVYRAQFPETTFDPEKDLIEPSYMPVRENDKHQRVSNIFYDATAGLWNAIGGTPFTESILNRYDHLFFGTISDLVAPYYPQERFRETHFAIFENPELARGAWRTQEEWYAEREC